MQQTNNPSHFEMVAFMSNGQMVLHDQSFGYSVSWQPSTTWNPPSSTTYQYSPTVCAYTNASTSDYTRHVAVVASGKLYYAKSGTDWNSDGTTTFSAWAAVGSATPASSPDCAVTSDGTVHIVVLTSAGTVAYVHGKSGSWLTTDLGTY